MVKLCESMETQRKYNMAQKAQFLTLMLITINLLSSS